MAMVVSRGISSSELPLVDCVCIFVQNRPTGDCYVQMSSVDAASKASDRLHKRNMGSRYIEVFQVRLLNVYVFALFSLLMLCVPWFWQCSGTEVTYALMDSAGARSGASSSSSSSRVGGKRRRASGATIKARGLPYRTSEYDLVEFFTDFCVSHSVVLLLSY